MAALKQRLSTADLVISFGGQKIWISGPFLSRGKRSLYGSLKAEAIKCRFGPGGAITCSAACKTSCCQKFDYLNSFTSPRKVWVFKVLFGNLMHMWVLALNYSILWNGFRYMYMLDISIFSIHIKWSRKTNKNPEYVCVKVPFLLWTI